MKNTKYTKWEDDNGVRTYTLELSDGTKFEQVPMDVGNYVWKLEKELEKLK